MSAMLITLGDVVTSVISSPHISFEDYFVFCGYHIKNYLRDVHLSVLVFVIICFQDM